MVTNVLPPFYGTTGRVGLGQEVVSQNFPSLVGQVESGPLSKMSNKYTSGICLGPWIIMNIFLYAI